MTYTLGCVRDIAAARFLGRGMPDLRAAFGGSPRQLQAAKQVAGSKRPHAITAADRQLAAKRAEARGAALKADRQQALAVKASLATSAVINFRTKQGE